MGDTVVVTGAAGRIGRYLRNVDGGLPARGWELVLVDTVEPGEAHTAIDIGDDDALDALTHAMTGAAAVVHLAGIPHEDTWDALRRTNIDGTYRVLEAARRAGVRRIVLASSCHAVGYYPTGTVAPADRPVRPDTLYGVSKAALEALGSLYADRHGLEVVSLRIGMCADRPLSAFDLGIWLSPGDAVRLVDAALRGPVTGPTVVYGISANTRGWWDLNGARSLGYAPQDDAEHFAGDVTEYTGPSLLGADMAAS